ncbi:MAG: hypothetical protein IH918_06380 [Acidobacteria bacterium]|nr:hypothetical protein [Acidobacteriota bacterium]
MFDSGCQRFEDVIVDLNDVPGQPLVSVTVQRGNGVQMMTERVVRLDNHEPPMPNTIDFVQFLTAMREELADQLSQPFNVDDEMPNWVAGRIASRVQELTPSAHPERTGLERSYGYDPMGPLVSMTAPDGGVTFLTYLNRRLTS